MSKAMKNYLNERKPIVNSVKFLFAGKGYTAASRDRVAAKAGIARQTIYRYLRSKTDVFKTAPEAVAGGDQTEFLARLFFEMPLRHWYASSPRRPGHTVRRILR